MPFFLLYFEDKGVTGRVKNLKTFFSDRALKTLQVAEIIID